MSEDTGTSHPGPEGPLPAWARALDTMSVGLIGLAVMIAAFGGFRFRVAGLRISLMSAPRVWLLAAVAIAVRHLIVRRAPLYARALSGLRAAWRSPAGMHAVPMWLASRLGVLAIGYFAVVTIGYPPAAPPYRLSGNEALNLPVRWDTGWYLGIASEGYRWDPGYGRQQNIAFMPALPMGMRVLGRMLGDRPLLAGQVIVLGASLWAFVYLFRLARDLLGDDDRAGAAVALVAAYPFSVFYSAIYTESLFLLGAVAAFYHLRRRECWRAAVWGLLVGFMRPNGFLLAAPLGTLVLWPAAQAWWRARHAPAARPDVRGLVAPMVAAAVPVLGVVVFSAFIWSLTGDPLTWLRAHAAWGRTFGGVTDIVVGPYTEIAGRGLYEFTRSLPVDTWNAVAALLGLAAVWPVTRRFGPAYGLFLVINLIPPMMAGGLLSIGRLTSTLFPIFLWLAAIIPARHRAAWLIAFALGQALGAALFFTWRQFI